MRDLFGKTPADYAIACYRALTPPVDGVHVAFSGGLQSIVLEECARRSGVKFDAHFYNTGVEHPALLKFIREHYPEVIWEKPRCGFIQGIQTKGLPTRTHPWCCEYLKECHGIGRVVAIGAMASESVARSHYAQVATVTNRFGTKTIICPLLWWTVRDCWDFVRENKLPYCELYDQGWRRIGCIPCPKNPDRRERLAQRPRLEQKVREAAQRSWERQTPGMMAWKSGDEYYEWWLSDESMGKGEDECQLALMFT